MNGDVIQIRRLKVSAYIGVPDEERATEQDLWISVSMLPSQGFAGLGDDVSKTVDYYNVSIGIAGIASAKPRHLIETLAEDIAGFLLSNHPLSWVEVEVEKQILPEADAVSVRIRRGRG